MLEFLNSTTFSFIWNFIVAVASILVFVKMGLSGWAAIIPIYGQWCLFDRIWGKGGLFLALWIFALMFFPIAATVILTATYFMVFKGFGKSTVLSIIFSIFTPIGLIVCAADGSTFCG